MLILFLVLFSVSAYAKTNSTNLSGGYYFTQGQNTSPDSVSQESTTSGDWELISFWDLPLWVKIASIPTIIISIAGLLVLLPFIIGRLKNKIKSLRGESIKNFIKKNPNCTIAEVAHEQHISRGTVKHYLNQLISKSEIAFKRIGKFTRLSTKQSSNKEGKTMDIDISTILIPHLRNEKKKLCLYAILDKPGVINQELSLRFNLDKSTIHDYLKELYRGGIIEFKRDGKFKRYYVKPEFKTLLIQFKANDKDTIFPTELLMTGALVIYK